MTINLLRRLCADRPAFGAWCSVPAPLNAEVMASVGVDYVCIDCQHGLIGYDSTVAMLQAMARTGATPVVRVPWNEPTWIGNVLDAGAEVVIVPMVNHADEAARAAGATHYPPRGTRSYGTVRTAMFLGIDTEQVDREVIGVAMIETRHGLDNLDAICSTPGIGGIYVGPSDLAFILGFKPRQSPIPDEVAAAIEAIAASCHRHGVIAGIHAGSGTSARRYAQAGYR
jgi:4-hydroxy-2-oxoheptanedioate aldolase